MEFLLNKIINEQKITFEKPKNTISDDERESHFAGKRCFELKFFCGFIYANRVRKEEPER